MIVLPPWDRAFKSEITWKQEELSRPLQGTTTRESLHQGLILLTVSLTGARTPDRVSDRGSDS